MTRVGTFVGFTPESKAGRRFDLWRMMPRKNRDEDLTTDLKRYALCLQEIFNLMLLQVDRFTYQFDPDLCTDDQIDLMLEDMGNPFVWADLTLTPNQRRKLLTYLVQIYKLKGTSQGIEGVVYFLMGLDVTVVDYIAEGWTLGVDELGSGSIAQIGCRFVAPYDFTSLTPPWEIGFSVDEGTEQLLEFVAGDFVDPSSGTAEEVSTVISRLVGADTYIANDGEPAQIVGGPAPYAVNPGDVLRLVISGVSRDVWFSADDMVTAGDMTAAELSKVLLREGIGFSSSYSISGDLVLTSNDKGSLASMVVLNDPSNTAAVALGFSLGDTDLGKDGKSVYVFSESPERGSAIRCTTVGLSADQILGFNPYGASIGGAILSTSDSRTRYSFDIETAVELTAAQKSVVRAIAEYMKPAHTHLVNIRVANGLPWPEGWVLGVGILGEDTELME